MYRLSEELIRFIPGPNSVLVATRNPSLAPFATRACGIRVVGPDRIDVLLPRETSGRSIADLENNREIAVCVGSPLDYRTVQLKGKMLSYAAATPDDVELSHAQLVQFAQACESRGMPRERLRNAWLFDLLRVEVQLVRAYLQTPGPKAGTPLEGEHGP